MLEEEASHLRRLCRWLLVGENVIQSLSKVISDHKVIHNDSWNEPSRSFADPQMVRELA